ncbi:MAG: 4Fe-4S binding protein, partial [Clostridia bacterium]|nr:4Fe-4S binding protein [Clostridia bacterium]
MEICKSNKCTGCGGCVDICPKGCVELITDKDGFYTSLVNENACVNCGLCKKICPGNTCNNSNAIKKAYK